MAFLGYAPILKVSARTGLGVHKLLPTVAQAAWFVQVVPGAHPLARAGFARAMVI